MLLLNVTLKREKTRISKEDFSVVSFLKACSWWKDLCEDSRIHAYIVRKRVARKSSYIATVLINMYVKCGAPLKAQKLLGKLSS